MDATIETLHPRPEGRARPRQPLVWDLPVRVFHWALAATVAVAATTAFIGPRGWLDVHAWAGYTLVGLLAFRLLWGLVGGRHSRFRALVLAPAALIEHLRGLVRGRSTLHAGHNPPGSWMTVTLLGTLALVAATGIVTLGGQENLGPLAAIVDFKTGRGVKELHEGLAWTVFSLVGLHLAGVAMETFRFRHPVVRSMVTGRKPVGADGREPKGPLAARGLIVVAVAALIVLGAGRGLASLPNGRWHALAPWDQNAYVAACGDCHHAHHPSLRTAAEWRKIMAGLSDHFGEDASLAPVTARIVTDFLAANDATTFDTKAANRIGRAGSASGRITETRFWKRRHRKIADAVFHRKGIGSKVNCNACHANAATGLFAAAAIHIPKEKAK